MTPFIVASAETGDAAHADRRTHATQGLTSSRQSPAPAASTRSSPSSTPRSGNRPFRIPKKYVLVVIALQQAVTAVVRPGLAFVNVSPPTEPTMPNDPLPPPPAITVEQPRITTRCPSCGHQTLFIGSGGHLTCSWLECKAPSLDDFLDEAAAHLQALQQENERLVDERDEARLIVSLVNNEVIGSAGYFTNPSCVVAVQDLKLHANRAAARADAAETALRELREIVEREKALHGSKGGQSVGRSPRMQLSLVKELEQIIHLASPSPRVSEGVTGSDTAP